MRKINKIVSIVSFNSADLLPLHPNRAVGNEGMRFMTRLRDWIVRWQSIRRSRKALCHLTTDQLRDIGLTRSEATREYRRSYYID